MKDKTMGDAIKDMSEIDFPAGLHGKILRQIVFLRFRTPFTIIVSLLSLNLAISSWRVLELFGESEVLTVVSLLWEAADVNFSGFWQFLGDAFSVAPIGPLALFAVNLLALLYVALYVPAFFGRARKTAQS